MPLLIKLIIPALKFPLDFHYKNIDYCYNYRRNNPVWQQYNKRFACKLRYPKGVNHKNTIIQTAAFEAIFLNQSLFWHKICN